MHINPFEEEPTIIILCKQILKLLLQVNDNITYPKNVCERIEGQKIMKVIIPLYKTYQKTKTVKFILSTKLQ